MRFAAIVAFATLTISSAVASAQDEISLSSLRLQNFKINIPMLLLESVGIEWEFGISDGLSIGPMGTVTKHFIKNDIDLQAHSLGVHSTYKFNNRRFESGWIFSGFYEHLFLTLIYNGLKPAVLDGSASGDHFGLIYGYQWVHSSGFNFSLGIGVAKYSFDESVNLETVYSGRYLESSQRIPSIEKINSLYPAVDMMFGFAI